MKGWLYCSFMGCNDGSRRIRLRSDGVIRGRGAVVEKMVIWVDGNPSSWSERQDDDVSIGSCR
jgi:hypothetical protein